MEEIVLLPFGEMITNLLAIPIASGFLIASMPMLIGIAIQGILRIFNRAA